MIWLMLKRIFWCVSSFYWFVSGIKNNNISGFGWGYAEEFGV